MYADRTTKNDPQEDCFEPIELTAIYVMHFLKGIFYSKQIENNKAYRLTLQNKIWNHHFRQHQNANKFRLAYRSLFYGYYAMLRRYERSTDITDGDIFEHIF